MSIQDLEPGRVLKGRYRLERQLGAGGMGSIWHAEDQVLSAPVAVKVLSEDVTDSEETVARFEREAKSAAGLRSPHVVHISDYGVDEGAPFIVMELLEGETLRQRIKDHGPLAPAEMVRIVAHVGRAMTKAHAAGIVHRDLKPENIFLVHNEDAEVAKVLDFGVAKVSAATLGPDATRTKTGSILGTPFYMSPEQAQGNKEVDFTTDLWALGVIAFECLTGKRPFDSDALGDLVLQVCVRPIPVPSEHATVPAGFDEWFARATERDQSKRFTSAREMVDALRDCLGDEYRLTITTTPEDELCDSEPEPAVAEPLGATVLAGPPESEARAADEATTRQDAPGAYGRPSSARGPLYPVAGLALVLGLLAGGLYGILSWNGPTDVEDLPGDERPLPIVATESDDDAGQPSPELSAHTSFVPDDGLIPESVGDEQDAGADASDDANEAAEDAGADPDETVDAATIDAAGVVRADAGGARWPDASTPASSAVAPVLPEPPEFSLDDLEEDP